MRLEGKTALITGGTSGIGFATSALFAREGARVAVIGRDESRFDQVKDQLGDDALVIGADVRSITSMQAASRRVSDAFGLVDIFFANAGEAFATPPEEIQAIEDRLAARVPLGRIGEAGEIAQAVLFLASDESRYMLGSEIVVDGGISQL